MTVTPTFLGLLAQAAGAGGVGRGQIQGGWEYVWAAYVVFWLALALYALYPTAPPRLLPEWGFTDSVAEAVGPAAENSAAVLYNPYAAVPSMHVAFALMIAIPAMKLVANRWLRYAWATYPAIVTFVVVVTANHFWLDAAFGAAVAAIAAATAHAAFGRARPEAWAWRSAAPAKATA
jgi:hypothetical protein